jgi:hypothetical protein
LIEERRLNLIPIARMGHRYIPKEARQQKFTFYSGVKVHWLSFISGSTGYLLSTFIAQ